MTKKEIDAVLGFATQLKIRISNDYVFYGIVSEYLDESLKQVMYKLIAEVLKYVDVVIDEEQIKFCVDKKPEIMPPELMQLIRKGASNEEIKKWFDKQNERLREEAPREQKPNN